MPLLPLFDILAPYYLWLKAFHVIAVIAWMAGLLYLPRLFVYHCEAARGSTEDQRFKTMEGRLFGVIMRPSMAAVWLLGLTLLFLGGHWDEGWFHAKLLLVVGLTGFHEYLGRCRRNFAEGKNVRSQRYFRMINEIPALIMMAIVILAVVKPF